MDRSYITVCECDADAAEDVIDVMNEGREWKWKTSQSRDKELFLYGASSCSCRKPSKLPRTGRGLSSDSGLD